MRIPPYPSKPHAASGQARVKFKGKHYYLGSHNSQESYRRYAEFVATLSNGATAVPVESLTIADAVARFLGQLEKPTSEKTHYRLACGILAKTHGTTALASFSPIHLDAVRKAMITAGWARSYINAQTIRLRAMFKWLEFSGLSPRGLWQSLKTLPPLPKTVRQTKPRQGVDWPDVAAVLPYLPAAVQAMVQVQYWSGMRPSEVCRMKVDAVFQDGGDWLYRLASHKNAWRPGRETEFVVLGPEAMAALLPWLEAARRRGPDAWLFPTSRPTRSACYTTAGYARALCRVFDAHKELVRFCPYSLRHAAKRRIARMHGADVARAALRQSTVATTLKYDGGQDLELAKRAARDAG